MGKVKDRRDGTTEGGDRGRRKGTGGEKGWQGRKDGREGRREGEGKNLAPTVISKSRRLCAMLGLSAASGKLIFFNESNILSIS